MQKVYSLRCLKTRGHEIAVGRGFDTYEDIEEAVKQLENERHHPFRCFNSQSVNEYNLQWEKTGRNLRLAESLKFAFVSYRLIITESLLLLNVGSRLAIIIAIQVIIV